MPRATKNFEKHGQQSQKMSNNSKTFNFRLILIDNKNQNNSNGTLQAAELQDISYMRIVSPQNTR
jgi:hypothetical protein